MDQVQLQESGSVPWIRFCSKDQVLFQGSGSVPWIRFCSRDQVLFRGLGSVPRIRFSSMEQVQLQGSISAPRIRFCLITQVQVQLQGPFFIPRFKIRILSPEPQTLETVGSLSPRKSVQQTDVLKSPQPKQNYYHPISNKFISQIFKSLIKIPA